MKTFTEAAWAIELKPSPKLLLLALARRSEETSGICAASIPELARELCTSLMTVYESIKTLEKKGLVSVRRSKNAKPNEYCLLLEVWV